LEFRLEAAWQREHVLDVRETEPANALAVADKATSTKACIATVTAGKSVLAVTAGARRPVRGATDLETSSEIDGRIGRYFFEGGARTRLDHEKPLTEE
jgi:hypothetical protein